MIACFHFRVHENMLWKPIFFIIFGNFRNHIPQHIGVMVLYFVTQKSRVRDKP